MRIRTEVTQLPRTEYRTLPHRRHGRLSQSLLTHPAILSQASEALERTSRKKASFAPLAVWFRTWAKLDCANDSAQSKVRRSRCTDSYFAEGQSRDTLLASGVWFRAWVKLDCANDSAQSKVRMSRCTVSYFAKSLSSETHQKPVGTRIGSVVPHLCGRLPNYVSAQGAVI